ncbi:hypothetical protein [Pseudomonas sp. NPDC089569]|uniref:hypothetical protein n=1 Tax=Pseudomonas sp. NPDC089569 TaxID=3390722 RepID=UPI003D04B0DD
MNFRTTTTDSTHFENVFGTAAPSVRNQLSLAYGMAAGEEPSAWESRLYENGLVALAPVAGTSELQKRYDLVNLPEAFCKAIGRAAEALAHQDEEHEALDMLASVMEKAEELAAAA